MDEVGEGDVLAVEAVGVETGHPTVPLGIIARRGPSRRQAIGFEALHRVISGPIEPIEMQADVQVGVCAVGLRRTIWKGDEPVRATDEHHLKTRRLEVSCQVDGQIQRVVFLHPTTLHVAGISTTVPGIDGDPFDGA